LSAIRGVPSKIRLPPAPSHGQGRAPLPHRGRRELAILALQSASGGVALSSPLRGLWTCLFAIAIAATSLAALEQQSKSSESVVDSAFARFWQAQDPQKALSAVDAVVRSGVGFDDALARLRRGREYSTQVPRGIVRAVRQTSDNRFLYSLDIPSTY